MKISNFKFQLTKSARNLEFSQINYSWPSMKLNFLRVWTIDVAGNFCGRAAQAKYVYTVYAYTAGVSIFFNSPIRVRY